MKKILLMMAALLAAGALNAQELTVLHVNDTHSHIDPQRSGEYVGRGGVIEQAASLDEILMGVLVISLKADTVGLLM